MTTSYQKIHQETNYSKFHFFEENRKVRSCHVNKLKESIVKDNRMHLHPIICVKTDVGMAIIDGQHRYEACKSLNIPVHYVINENPDDISMIDDQISLQWKFEDYLKYYICKEYPNYIKVKEIMDKYNMPLGVITVMMGTQKTSNGKLFREGKLEVSKKVESFFSHIHLYYEKIKKEYPKTNQVLYRRNFLHALFWFFRKYGIETFEKVMEKLAAYIESFDYQGSREYYEKELIKTYNKVKGKGVGLIHPSDELKKKTKKEQLDDEY